MQSRNALYMTDQFSSLLTFVGTLPRGTIFFAEDCLPTGLSLSEIRTHLSTAVQEGHVVRLARGVFLWPSIEEVSLRPLMPSMDAIIRAVAKRESIRIAPCEEQCAYMFGLSGGQHQPYKYITDGGNRKIHLVNGHILELAWRKESRIFTIRSETMKRLTLGIRFVGADMIGWRDRDIIADALSGVSDEDFNDAIWKTPEWVRNLLVSLRK